MKMPFGKFKSYDLADLPDDYLKWLWFEIELREPLRSEVEIEYLSRQGGHCSTAITTLTANEMKKIYWNLARQYHPDIIGGTGDVMKGINIFYEAIKQ